MASTRDKDRTGGTAVQDRPETGSAMTRREGNGGSRNPARGTPSRWAGALAGVPASPWELMQRMSEEMNQLFDALGGSRSTPAAGATGVLVVPNIEVERRDNDLIVRADLPGLGADDVNVTVDRGQLIISGERRQEQREDREGVIRSEVIYGTFYRTIPLPDGADESRVAATFRNGVLEITIPVTEREQGRRVQVESQS